MKTFDANDSVKGAMEIHLLLGFLAHLLLTFVCFAIPLHLNLLLSCQRQQTRKGERHTAPPAPPGTSCPPNAPPAHPWTSRSPTTPPAPQGPPAHPPHLLAALPLPAAGSALLKEPYGKGPSPTRARPSRERTGRHSPAPLLAAAADLPGDSVSRESS